MNQARATSEYSEENVSDRNINDYLRKRLPLSSDMSTISKIKTRRRTVRLAAG
jgi:hypothetical protein